MCHRIFRPLPISLVSQLRLASPWLTSTPAREYSTPAAGVHWLNLARPGVRLVAASAHGKLPTYSLTGLRARRACSVLARFPTGSSGRHHHGDRRDGRFSRDHRGTPTASPKLLHPCLLSALFGCPVFQSIFAPLFSICVCRMLGADPCAAQLSLWQPMRLSTRECRF
jgi:hypothetical protein